MKKLIIFAAAAFIACASNAAVANWRFGAANVYAGSSEKYSGTAYVFDSAVITMSALYDAVVADSTYLSGNAIASKDVVSGAITAVSTVVDFSYGNAGSSYNLYFAILDGDKIYFSNEKSVTGNGSAAGASLAFGTQNNNTTTFSATAPSGTGFAGAGHWSSVPEPTSGLLLLLGMAGLALKRKQA